MMGAFGRFLEISVPTADILKSLAFWRDIGFAELPTGDIRRHHYAVVTDGVIAVGLHAAGIEEPALSFVRPNLAKQVRALEEAGQAFEFTRLGAEEFHEAGLRSPDGQLIVMMEARTFSPGGAHEPPTALIGRCTEVTLSCSEPDRARPFWEAAGFLGAEAVDAGVVLMTAPGITIGLRAGPATGIAALRFRPPATTKTSENVQRLGLACTPAPGGQLLISPERLQLIIT